jgi:hypothetical protein
MKSDMVRVAEIAAKSKRDDALMKIVGDPQVVNLAILFGGLLLAQKLRFSEDETQNNTLRAVATSGVVLVSISRAGVSGWPALTAAGLAGLTTTEGAGTLDPLANAIGARSIWSRIFG